MRILVIDDDRDMRESLKTGLQSECYVVDTVGTGEDGLYMSRTHDYDLILLDSVLPKKSGIQVCREIRAAGRSTPIIIVSVQSRVDDKVEFLNAGADDYVTKPFSFEELKSRIRALLRRPSEIVNQIIEVDDLVIDCARQKVTRGTKEIYLTRKEFALLHHLATNGGAVASRASLMEHVWNDEIDPLSNTLESHIANLRKKIDRPAHRKIIETVPGRGYRMAA